ncbi:DUF1553 domain-containing protein [bacterium]|nr:DUF1553 domain-containing protein [bacterium]
MRTMLFALSVLVMPVAVASAADAPRVSFEKDIRPLLSDRCFHCHGPDEKTREASLRLDRRDAALASHDGETAIVPGKPEASGVWQRISSDDPDLKMPPPDSGKTLNAAEVDLIRRWIEQGADWTEHWSFMPPQKAELPTVVMIDGKAWPRNAIDHFVLARLQSEGLQPSNEAAKQTLIRRLSFDLIGLPPTWDEVQTFVGDDSPDAYDRLVDRLLQSKHFGERMAMVWLDAARYSDTDGYQGDGSRTNWPWRDWVIDAYNRDMPFDEFTVEQFAGDLLPNATPEQQLATCFHRNHMTNGEGGRDPEESRVDYVIDRLNTIGTVWLGLTLNCCQCHSHKYDPISQSEYYQLSAFFNSIDEDGRAGLGRAKPYLKYKSSYAAASVESSSQLVDMRKARLAAVRANAEKDFSVWLAEQRETIEKTGGFSTWQTLVADDLSTTDGTQLAQQNDGVIVASGPNPRHEDYRIVAPNPLEAISRELTGLKLEVLPHSSHTNGGLSRSESGDVILTNLKVSVRSRGGSLVREIPISSAVANFSAKKESSKAYGPITDVLDDDPRTGWTTRGSDVKEPKVAVFAFKSPVSVGPDDELLIELRHRSLDGQHNTGRFRLSVSRWPGPTVRSVDASALEDFAALKDRSEAALPGDLRKRLLDQFFAGRADVLAAEDAIARANSQLGEMKKAAGELSVMVLGERKEKRPSHVLIRGAWDKPGDEVSYGVPQAVLPWSVPLPTSSAGEQNAEAARPTRLELAKWLVDRRNPLTARVTVNRYWQMIFGDGLVRTPEDFGAQGEPPTHPQLLDWLAVEFVDSDWDIRHILRLIVTSATYRQSSSVSTELLARDPENRLLARAPRYRLPAWMIRDGALRSSGLLNPQIGGPPVYPYQPPGIWAENTMGRFHYQPTEGPDQFRRTVYAFWRRSVAPTFLFDSAQRRVCQIKVSRTNTPLQALTLLNDHTLREASLRLAERACDSAESADDRVTFLVEQILTREPAANERSLLSDELNQAARYFGENPEAASRFVMQQPEAAEESQSLRTEEIAAATVVASTLLNLDEAMTRE